MNAKYRKPFSTSNGFSDQIKTDPRNPISDLGAHKKPKFNGHIMIFYVPRS